MSFANITGNTAIFQLITCVMFMSSLFLHYIVKQAHSAKRPAINCMQFVTESVVNS